MNIIILHGLGQMPKDWETVRKRLEKDSSDVVLCPEIADWIRQKDPCYDRLYTEFEAYCEQLNGMFHLCGLSLGGILALQYSARHPNRVGSLILIGTQYKMPKRLLWVQNKIFQLMPDAGFLSMGVEKRQLIDLSKSMMDVNLTAELQKITCPVLILCGKKDWVNWPASKRLKKAIPHAKIERIAQASHEVNKDNPDAAGERIRKFLETMQ